MDLKKTYGTTDVDLENNGVEVDLGDGAFVTVRRSNNKRFADALMRARKPHERRIQRGNNTAEFRALLDDLTRKAVAEHVLIGWRGIEVDGKPIKYSPQAAEKLMKEFEDFQEDVLTAANSRETFRKEVIEENEKNS